MTAGRTRMSWDEFYGSLAPARCPRCHGVKTWMPLRERDSAEGRIDEFVCSPDHYECGHIVEVQLSECVWISPDERWAIYTIDWTRPPEVEIRSTDYGPIYMRFIGYGNVYYSNDEKLIPAYVKNQALQCLRRLNQYSGKPVRKKPTTKKATAKKAPARKPAAKARASNRSKGARR